jgi:hypothetical protein
VVFETLSILLSHTQKRQANLISFALGAGKAKQKKAATLPLAVTHGETGGSGMDGFSRSPIRPGGGRMIMYGDAPGPGYYGGCARLASCASDIDASLTRTRPRGSVLVCFRAVGGAAFACSRSI